MNKIISFMVVAFVYMSPALTSPAYSASHAKADAVTTDTDSDKKKKAKEEEEEPDCD